MVIFRKKEFVRKANVYAGKDSKRETVTKRQTEAKTHVMTQEKKESELKLEPLKKKQLSYIVPQEQKKKLEVKPTKNEESVSRKSTE